MVKYHFLTEDPDKFKYMPWMYEIRYDQMLRYKSSNLKMDISKKSDRNMWRHLRYKSVLYPDVTLEFI